VKKTVNFSSQTFNARPFLSIRPCLSFSSPLPLTLSQPLWLSLMLSPLLSLSLSFSVALSICWNNGKWCICDPRCCCFDRPFFIRSFMPVFPLKCCCLSISECNVVLEFFLKWVRNGKSVGNWWYKRWLWERVSLNLKKIQSKSIF